ncbi:MAG: hypothetical protein LBS93_07390 [Synergistaceae bacterium]|nr:hypothetical protein [Synergistaceae bacterium]
MTKYSSLSGEPGGTCVAGSARSVESPASRPFFWVFFLALILCALAISPRLAGVGEAGEVFKPFVPTDPIMPLSDVKPGMKGECRTVIKGTEIISFPVEVLDIIPRSGVPRHLILIRAAGKTIEETGGIASGMSGSPMYIKGRLVGAIGYSWNFTSHDLGLVTPIEDMIEVWNYPERVPSFAPAPTIPERPMDPNRRAASGDFDKLLSRYVSIDVTTPGESETGDEVVSVDLTEIPPDALPSSGDLAGYIFVDGLSERMAEGVGEVLGRRTMPFGGGSEAQGSKKVRQGAKLVPGMAVAGALAWGDVEISATGTLTAMDADGRFIAFAHPFVGAGTMSAALMDATISKVIPGLESPFKYGFTGDITGIITQDRPQGIGGRVGVFAPAASCTVNMLDVDSGRSFQRRFQMIQDMFHFSEITSYAVVGLVENLWGRSGPGSAKITATFAGGALPDGWKRTNIFVSEKDVAKEMLQEFTLLTQILAVNQFQELRPFGIDVSVEMTQDPRVIYIEDVEVSKGTFHPGEKVSFDITLRPWRKAPFVRSYSLVIPENVSGICQLLVRGGGIAEEGAEYLQEGWRSISSLPILLREVDAKETNDQIVLELRGQDALENQIRKARNADPEDLINDKLNSEIKAEKMKDGSMRIIRTNYYVDGLIHKLIKVSGASSDDDEFLDDVKSGEDKESNKSGDEPGGEDAEAVLTDWIG